MSNQLSFGQQSIYRQGYGSVAKLVMRDKNLHAEAKAIYAYICSFAGSGNTAFPGADLMMHELNMSEKRFYKFRKELIDNGYITVEKTRKENDKNRRDRNIYHINPEKIEEVKKVKDTKKDEPSQNDSVEDEHSQFERFQFEHSQFESVQIEGCNNNSLNNNSLNNNSLNISSSIEEQKEEDKEEKSDLDLLMKFCNKHNYKLSRKKATSILEFYSLDKVTKAITHIITVKNISEIDSPGSYLIATLKDMETPKNINITVESKDKPSNFNNFTQRSYDYNKLEKQLLGWDDSEDDD